MSKFHHLFITILIKTIIRKVLVAAQILALLQEDCRLLFQGLYLDTFSKVTFEIEMIFGFFVINYYKAFLSITYRPFPESLLRLR